MTITEAAQQIERERDMVAKQRDLAEQANWQLHQENLRLRLLVEHLYETVKAAHRWAQTGNPGLAALLGHKIDIALNFEPQLGGGKR